MGWDGMGWDVCVGTVTVTHYNIIVGLWSVCTWEVVRVWGCGGEEGVGVHVRCIHTWGVVRVWGCGGEEGVGGFVVFVLDYENVC